MYAKVTTTITTEIDLDMLEPKHSVDIEGEDVLPENLIYAAVLGACKATIRSIEERSGLSADLEDD